MWHKYRDILKRVAFEYQLTQIHKSSRVVQIMYETGPPYYYACGDRLVSVMFFWFAIFQGQLVCSHLPTAYLSKFIVCFVLTMLTMQLVRIVYYRFAVVLQTENTAFQLSKLE